MTLFDEAEKKVRSIVETCRDHPGDDADGEERKIGHLYASFMDEERVEALGAQPLADELGQVEAITDVASFVRTLGTLERVGVGSVFGLFIAPDRGKPDRYITHLSQDGLGLPDESYYTSDDFSEIRAAYVAHVATMLDLAGLDDVSTRAERIMELETR